MAEPERDVWHKPAQPRLSVWERAELRQEDRRRMLQNIAAAIFLLAFLAGSYWVIDRIGAYSRNVECLQFKQRWCR
jgi:hypothetical protein